ncbi:hypothetical protein C5Y96_11105 [Blastopirellula marina]|uniref:WD domain, G-beta repeat n=1 Tax=Blastopirellula marina TaxID=124 RepID=A0A2S8FMH3_9BACT|nr:MULTISPECIES: WD40 repeat domain-containing protein [Pirellulaceae]PQO33389.1 hypothetical protein C5Y96_11105 [Blastopirellula marina]RCS52478.1 hypothetical protein DTL36_11115 [Bremerella cremea]
MKSGSLLGRTFVFSLVAVVLAVGWLTARAAADDSPVDFCIYSSRADASYVTSLRELLSQLSDDTTVNMAESLEQAAASDAEVLVLAMPDSRQIYSEELLDAIKRKKVIGLDFGAAQLFGQLKLLINGGACHFMTPKYHVPRLKQESSKLLGDQSPSPMFHPYRRVVPGDNFGMYISPQHNLIEHVDVIARCEFGEEYAPIVRQDNFVLLGYAAHPKDWNPQYRQLFLQVAQALLVNEMSISEPVETPTGKPGTYEYRLWQSRSPLGQSSQEFGFQFDQPVQFTAALTHTGSKAMMLLFRSELKTRHSTRKDAEMGESLAISVDITEEDIRENRGRYWILDSKNFDRINPAQCKLTIDIRPLEKLPADQDDPPLQLADEPQIQLPRSDISPSPYDLEFDQNVWTLNPMASYERPGASEGSAVDLKYSIDGRFIAIGGMLRATPPRTPSGGMIELWDVAAGRRTILSEGIETRIHPTLFSVAFSPDSRRLAAADSSGRVKVWSLAYPPIGEPEVFEFKDENFLNSTIADSLWFTPDGKELIVGAHPSQRFNLDTGESVKYVPQDTDKPSGTAAIERLRGHWYLPTAKIQVTTTAPRFMEGAVVFSDGSSGKAKATIVGLSYERPRIAISANGKLLAVNSARMKLTQDSKTWWDEYREYPTHRIPPTRIALFEINDGLPEFLAQVEVGHELISGIGLSPDGKTLVTCGSHLTFWDLSDIEKEAPEDQ